MAWIETLWGITGVMPSAGDAMAVQRMSSNSLAFAQNFLRFLPLGPQNAVLLRAPAARFPQPPEGRSSPLKSA